jgi:AraC-like DNA-binding protein
MSLACLDSPPAVAPVNAASLYRHPVFRCGDLRSSHSHLRSLISDHEIRSGAGEVDSTLFAAGTGRLQFMLLRYGPEVEVTPGAFEDFSLVQIPLRGCTEIECDGHRAELVPGQSAVVSPRKSLKLLWSADCEQLIVRVPNSLVRTAALGHAQWQRSAHNIRSLLAPLTVLDGQQGRRWNAQVQSLMDTVLCDDDEGSSAHPAWIGYSELGLALYLLTLQADAADDGAGADARWSGGRHQPMVLAERFARTRLCAPIALEVLARAAGVSARTLHFHCKREFGVGPMEWLRHLRLDVAREKLQQSGSAHVTEVAMACGFGHLGRFAAYYRERFGELPRETVVID